MDKADYMISDASKKVDVEQHTLRYWQDELKLDIKRNGLGHRVYNDEDISTFIKIKSLKEQGFQLKAIKMILPDINKLENLDPTSLLTLKEKINGDEVHKEGPEQNHEDEDTNTLMAGEDNHLQVSSASTDRMGQFRHIMKDIMADVLKDNNIELSDTVSMNVTNSVIKEMDYLLRMKEEREEERYRQFDRLLREYQSSRSHSAAAKDKKKRKKLFGASEI